MVTSPLVEAACSSRSAVPIPEAQPANYRAQVTDGPGDREWDAFLASTPGGHHAQSSCWAQLKATIGWRAVRVAVTDADRVVGGAQLLFKPLPLQRAGHIGYVTRGPLIAPGHVAALNPVLRELQRMAQQLQVRYLAVQPPANGAWIEPHLIEAGFRATTIELAPTATVLVDLHADRETLLARLKRRTRSNVRHGLKHGLTFREGDERDLPAYNALVKATSQRQQFASYSQTYFEDLWRLYRPSGYIRLFIVEADSRLVSAMLAITFGGTVINRLSVWSGELGSAKPNDVLQWKAIEWAQEHGYHYYDLEGIHRPTAEALLCGEEIPDDALQSVTSFKLGFGGQVILYPRAHEYIGNPALRWGYYHVFNPVSRRLAVENLVRGVRVSG